MSRLHSPGAARHLQVCTPQSKRLLAIQLRLHSRSVLRPDAPPWRGPSQPTPHPGRNPLHLLVTGWSATPAMRAGTCGRWGARSCWPIPLAPLSSQSWSVGRVGKTASRQQACLPRDTPTGSASDCSTRVPQRRVAACIDAGSSPAGQCHSHSATPSPLQVWRFFQRRITFEEYYLQRFFGPQFDAYAAATPSGIPGIP
jgi:hypothetical protein